MDQILHSALIESGKSTIVSDVMSRDGRLYVRLLQSIDNFPNAPKQSKLVLNASLVEQLLPVLLDAAVFLGIENVKNAVGDVSKSRSKMPLKSIQDKIIDAYLKGVPVKDLAKSFGMTKKEVEEVLNTNDLPLLSDKEMKPPFDPWQGYWNKKKRRK
ncbi:MAG: hypothetical protein K9J17_14375 [Flavobacteriales bacterium]|nr:hypothetical protein [Flavobacteriales bacterium]